jgi:hypothetical protein
MFLIDPDVTPLAMKLKHLVDSTGELNIFYWVKSKVRKLRRDCDWVAVLPGKSATHGDVAPMGNPPGKYVLLAPWRQRGFGHGAPKQEI